MASFYIEYFSQALHRRAAFRAWIPNDVRTELETEENPYRRKPMRTLFLLHGYTGNAENWIPEELMEKYNFAVVSPNGENGFYLDGEATGSHYQTLVATELTDYVRRTFGLARSREDTYIIGISMGGFGAIHTGLAFPDTFGKIGALSPALIVHGIAHMKPGEDNGMANYAYYRACFGDLETVEASEANPETLVRALKKAGRPIPALFQCCGSEDFLIEPNRQFHRFLEAEGVPHVYRESPGQHDMVFWREYIPQIVEWMFA